jgi:hypothetical protein
MLGFEARIRRLESRLEHRRYPRIIVINSCESLGEALSRLGLPSDLVEKERAQGRETLVVRWGG